MQTDVVNVQDIGVIPKTDHGDANRLALQGVEVSTATSATGTIRIIGDGDPTSRHWDKNLFVITDTSGNAAVAHVVFDGIRFQGGPEAVGA